MDGGRKIGVGTGAPAGFSASCRHDRRCCCKSAAREAGFMHAELLDTLAGDLVYLARAWHEIERAAPPTSIGWTCLGSDGQAPCG